MGGLENSEDAGVYRISDDVAIVQTVDFFTPVADDPRDFGRIAAANALSDVYAMGGVPITGLNVVGYPMKELGPDPLHEILAGGLEKIHEAGACLVGGHTVEDAELKYGVSVTGTVHPDRIVRNSGAQPGDRLVLSKPIGTGAVATALKRGEASDEAVRTSIESMAALNKDAALSMTRVGASAATDITGFGLLGHALEMARGSRTRLVFEAALVPTLSGALSYLEAGCVCGGTKRNADHYGGSVTFTRELPEAERLLLFDAQTSGGLLIAIAADRADALVADMRESGVAAAAIVGEVLPAEATDGGDNGVGIEIR